MTNITNPSGTVVKEYAYNEFGEVTAKGSDTFKNDITFTGSVKDMSTGLQYMNARFYEPSTGRFLSQDTYSGNPYDPWTQHLYAYVGNNPINMIDPTGHVAHRSYGRYTDADMSVYTRECGFLGLNYGDWQQNIKAGQSLFSHSSAQLKQMQEEFNDGRIKVYNPSRDSTLPKHQGYTKYEYRDYWGIYADPVLTKEMAWESAIVNGSVTELMEWESITEASVRHNPNYNHPTAINNGKVAAGIAIDFGLDFVFGDIWIKPLKWAYKLYDWGGDIYIAAFDKDVKVYEVAALGIPYIGHDIRDWTFDDTGWQHEEFGMNYNFRWNYSQGKAW